VARASICAPPVVDLADLRVREDNSRYFLAAITVIGDALGVASATPVPSCPKSFAPQHFMVGFPAAPGTMAQACVPPTATAVGPVSPVTVSNVVFAVVETAPRLSWPTSFAPAHRTLPSETKHVTSPPAAREVTLLSSKPATAVSGRTPDS